MNQHKDQQKTKASQKKGRGDNKLNRLHGLRRAAAARQRLQTVAAHAASIKKARAHVDTCAAWHTARIARASSQPHGGACELGAWVDGVGFAVCLRHAAPRRDHDGQLARLCRGITSPNGERVEYVAALARRMTRNWIQRMTRPATVARAAVRDGLADRPRLMASYLDATQGAAAALDRRLFGVPGTPDTGDHGALDDAATAAKLAAVAWLEMGKRLFDGERLTLAAYRHIYRAVTASYYKATGRGGREQLPGAEMIEERQEMATGYRPPNPAREAGRRLDKAARQLVKEAKALRARARDHWSKSTATAAKSHLKKDLVTVKQALLIALERSEGHGANSYQAHWTKVRNLKQKLAI